MPGTTGEESLPPHLMHLEVFLTATCPIDGETFRAATRLPTALAALDGWAADHDHGVLGGQFG